MTSVRLTFLYPALLRTFRAGAIARPVRVTAPVRCKSIISRRRGVAVEPLPLVGESGTLPPAAEGSEEDVNAESGQAATDQLKEETLRPVEEEEEEEAEIETTPKEPEPAPAPAEPPKEETNEERTKKTREEAKQGGPLEAVLHMQPPDVVAKQHPAMSPPPYVHHFDSYSMVKQLQDGGYSKDSATTAMKGIRTILASNLDVAQSSLVSKSDVENETYLFTAACSELSAEIRNNRRLQDEKLRQQRTLLQHEVEILTQKLNQEVLTLNDNVRGMFNDRKMAVREEQTGAESAVQQINYKISIMLSSDAKSEIEAVRWILIRRSVLGILFMAFLTLSTIRYATHVNHERQKEAERQRKQEEERRRDGGKKDHSSAADAAVILAAN